MQVSDHMQSIHCDLYVLGTFNIFIAQLQLLEIFNDMEVSNLALLQRSQEIEGMLESLKTKMREVRATNGAEISSLQSQLAVYNPSILIDSR